MPDQKIFDMHALRVFLTTAQDCNMSSAALRLGISQSAVSQTIRTLEDYFGTVLINRKERPLTLTPAGLTLRNRGATLLDEAMNLRGSVIEASLGVKPDLRLGLVDSFAATCGTRLIRSMLGKVAQLSVRTGLTPNLCEALVRRELDLVVSTDALEDMNGFVSHSLLSERFLLITPPNPPVAVRSVADLSGLSDALPIIRFNQQSHLGAQIDRALRRHGLKPTRRLEVDTADTLTSMVAGGLGWAITTPLCMLQGAQFARAVTPIFLDSLEASRAIYLLARQDEYNQLVRDTFDATQTLLRDDIRPELRAIHPRLDTLLQFDDWKDHA